MGRDHVIATVNIGGMCSILTKRHIRLTQTSPARTIGVLAGRTSDRNRGTSLQRQDHIVILLYQCSKRPHLPGPVPERVLASEG